MLFLCDYIYISCITLPAHQLAKLFASVAFRYQHVADALQRCVQITCMTSHVVTTGSQVSLEGNTVGSHCI